MMSTAVQDLRSARPSWTDRLSATPEDGWSRLARRLLDGGRWKPSQIASLASESARVLRHLPDPKQPAPFQGRGLVVGYVQSGKTANYTAVAARGVDAGYRMVIVLSGIHDALRNQTQARLESELVGVDEAGGPAWTLLTTREGDFREPPVEVLGQDGAFLIVTKKNVPVLKRLDGWLEAAADRLDGVPILVIDDEADQASINTRGNRPPDPSLDADATSAAATGPGPTATNRLIRALLRRVPQAAYVAYTATPFANIFIDPDAVDREVGEDLFPRDFALQLPRPEGYTGTEELFGVSAQGRDVFRRTPDEDVPALRQATTRRNARPVTATPQDRLLPDSLSDAILAFCLAGAIREGRPGLAGRPHTMLVHVSVRVQDQTRVRNAIEDQRGLWLEAVRQGHDLRPLFEETLALHFQGVCLPAAPSVVAQHAIGVLERLDVLELNSETGEDLEYDEKPARHLIAVGGNRLSRGLTLEGLTISYFLRTATMADTLLQMARWYGFRTGYEDLIRIWTTDGIAQWFTELALVEESLRDSLQALYRAGRRPAEMAIRLRAHSALLLTARNKAAMAHTVRQSWSGEHPQTVVLPLHDQRRLDANRGLADRLISQCGPGRAITGGRLFQDLPPETICDFLRLYQPHTDAVSLRGDALADWIMQRAAEGELVDWSVVLASAQRGAAVTIGGIQTQVVSRRRTSSEGIGILIDPRHEGADLPGGPDAFVRASGNYDAEAMRSARSPTKGLLMLYPLDPEPLDVQGTDAVIAIALSLPYTSDGRSSAVINRGVSA
ncbi:Z1 domain-containing protein [Brevundimonas lutea]|uniref:Z1 domain-containing protein n=1 Tax=Brevundimonas lutea TaxID=2293980 RepID=UPI000F031683|nr:Z1 domain-containing protein [Brevundimonas lutea]